MYLPFTTVNPDVCQAVKLCYKLHTQCTKKKEGAHDYCKTCLKQITSSNNKPQFGDIRDRVKHLHDYVDPQGNKTLPFYKVMKRLNVTREQVEEEAKKQGIEIDPWHWNEKIKRGRPKQEVEIIDESDEIESFKSKDVIECETFEFEHKMYLRSKDNHLYDIDTEDYIGTFNETTQTIEMKL